MSYIALYRKWRPLVFEDVVEQEHVVKTLKNSVTSQRIAHAYLFCGTRGTGKTTMAKILSRAINCLSPNNGDPCNQCEICKGILNGSILDVIEIDAASNNSVDNIREIRDEVIYVPSKAKYKVYIIDEVHMLSTGAFNALLKTLEEPPAHVVFILATTEAHKLPATILSRCQRFDFRRITVDNIVERITSIASSSDISIQNEAARLIAKMSDGALRDAISILDQCIATGSSEISYDDVLNTIGITDDSFLSDIVDGIVKKDIGKILSLLDRLIMQGKDISKFVSDMVYYYRNMMICKMTKAPSDVLEVTKETLEKIKKQAEATDMNTIINIIKELSALEGTLKWSAYPRVLFEVSLVKICQDYVGASDEDLFDRIAVLEKKIVNLEKGNFAIPTKQTTNITDQKVQEKATTYERNKVVEKDDSIGKIDLSGKELSDWSKMIDEMKSNGRMVLYSNLVESKAIEIDEKHVGIIFGPDSGFARTIVSRAENMEYLQELLGKKLGREMKIKVIDESQLDNSKNNKDAKAVGGLDEKLQDMSKRFGDIMNIIDE